MEQPRKLPDAAGEQEDFQKDFKTSLLKYKVSYDEQDAAIRRSFGLAAAPIPPFSWDLDSYDCLIIKALKQQLRET